MAGFLQGLYGVVLLNPGHQEIVRVERGQGKHADVLVPQGIDKSCEDAHGGPVERTDDLQTKPACRALKALRNPLLGAYDRQFIFSASDAHKGRRMPRPFWNSDARMQ